jgi:hypothetical protein
MQHLRCDHCLRILIADFWEMVERETVQTFSSFTLTCECGNPVQAVPARRPRWRKLDDAKPYMAAVSN